VCQCGGSRNPIEIPALAGMTEVLEAITTKINH